MEASAHRDEPDAQARILRAATELIASDGIDEVRIARVANRARASTALVHHYFSTREELLAQALLQSFELAADERFGAGPAAATSAAEGLAIAIEECLPTPGEGEREWVLWVELWLRAAREPELRPVAGRMYERYREWVARVIRRGVESGEFREVDPDQRRRPRDGPLRRARRPRPDPRPGDEPRARTPDRRRTAGCRTRG